MKINTKSKRINKVLECAAQVVDNLPQWMKNIESIRQAEWKAEQELKKTRKDLNRQLNSYQSKKEKNMITGSEARELAGSTALEIVQSLEPFIRSAAANHERRLMTGYTKDLPHQHFWINGGYTPEPRWVEAKRLLEGFGFEVSFFYEERQFVNMYTLIEW